MGFSTEWISQSRISVDGDSIYIALSEGAGQLDDIDNLLGRSLETCQTGCLQAFAQAVFLDLVYCRIMEANNGGMQIEVGMHRYGIADVLR